MRRAWVAAPFASMAMMLVVACRSESVQEEAVEVSETNLSSQARAKANAFIDDAAVSWVSKDDWGFVQGGRCVMSCHTTVPFMMLAGARTATANADAGTSSDGGTSDSGTSDAGPSALATVRGHVEARVNSWAT